MTKRRQSNVTTCPQGRGRPERRGFGAVIAISTLACVLGCDVEPVDQDPLDQPAAGPSSAADTGNDGSDLAVLRSPESMRARATLEPTQGNQARGTVDFTKGAHGVLIAAELTGLEPGTHGIHVHEFGDCSAPDGSSAGDHFTPEMDPHGAPRDEPEAHHAGDLGNITADASGSARKEMGDVELTIEEGEFSVVGRAVVVHAGEDDLTSQPSGDAGDPVACGVVELVDSETLDRG